MPGQLEWLGGSRLREAVGTAKLFRQAECELTLMLNISLLFLCSPTPVSRVCVCM